MSIVDNEVAVEYNANGYLLHSVSFPGAYTRGKDREEALRKFPEEIARYCKWAGISLADGDQIVTRVVQEKLSALQICDADSDVIFDSERIPMSVAEFRRLRKLVLKSAWDFATLTTSIPDKDRTCLHERVTFYGSIPRTATEMYDHVNTVTCYYAGEVGADIANLPDIVASRVCALRAIASTEGYLQNAVRLGSYNEEWSVRKVLRRFIWHDRIHARAMYRMATKIWSADVIEDPYYFHDEFTRAVSETHRDGNSSR